MIKVKRIYEEASRSDGYRVLVDRVWPRGVKKDDARLDSWLRDIAPSSDLRKWFSHDKTKWDEFKEKYYEELDKKQDYINDILKQQQRQKNVTLLFGSRDKKYNNAVALREYLQSMA